MILRLIHTRERARVLLFVLLSCFAMAPHAWAGEDMSSASFRIRRNDVNSGGSNQPTSANYKMIDSAGSDGGSQLNGATQATFVGFSNIVSHPNTILNLNAVTGSATGQLSITWTSPVAYGSTGAATSYWVKTSANPFAAESDFFSAATYAQSWTPVLSGQAESRVIDSLSANTTYYCAVKALDQAGNAGYVSNSPGASTLTDFLQNVQLYQVGLTSITANWTHFNPGSGANTAEGYELDASTMASFSPLWTSSTTTDVVNSSTMTVGLSKLLTPDTTYYLRVGGINYNGVVNYVVLAATRTAAGPAPQGVHPTNVYTSSMTVAWTPMTSYDGYVLEAGPDANFTTIDASSVTADVSRSSLTFNSTLLANTTYYLRVGSLWHGTTSYGYSTPPSTSTLTNLLQSVQVYYVGVDSITVNWTAFNMGSGGDSAEGYRLEASSTTFDGTGTVYFSSSSLPAPSTLTVTGLTPNVNYWLRAGALNHNGVPNYVAPTGSPAKTIAGQAPLTVRITQVFVSSLTVTWDPVGGSGGYSLEASTDSNFNTPIISSVTLDASLSTMTFNSGSLDPNTPYYVRVGSLWNGATNYSLMHPSTSTLTNLITGAQFFSIGVSSISVGWPAFDTGSGTDTARGYVLQYSTMNFDGTGAVESSTTYTVEVSTLGFSGLVPQTTYYFRVGALNWNFVPNFAFVGSTATLGVPAPQGFHGNVQGVSSITWTWGVVSIPGVSYNLYSASAPAAPIQTGIAATLSTETNLSTNSVYGRMVTAVLVGVESSFSNQATYYTFAAVPGQPVPSNVAYTSFTVTWSTNTNPGTTPFEVSYSTAGDFSGIVSTPAAFPPPTSFTSNTTDFVGLTPGTTYFFRVRAANGDGFATTFSAYGSTTTLPAPVPTGLSAQVLGVSSISWNWNSVMGASAYNLYEATAPAVLVISTPTPGFMETGLSTNTPYGLTVTAFVKGVESARSPAVSSYTYAMAPGAPTAVLGTVGYSSFTVTWSTNTNPGWTPYEVSYSTAGDFTGIVSTPVAFNGFFSDSATLTGLTPATTYYVRVRAQNGDGIDTVFSSTGSAVTLPTPIPTGLSAQVLGVSSISWNWNSVTEASAYNLYEATAPAVLVISTPTPGFVETGLSTNTQYGLMVTAVVNTIESAKSTAVSSYTFAAIPGQPVPSSVGYSSFTVTWSTNTNPGMTPFEVSYSSDPTFATLVSTPVAFPGFTANTTDLLNLMPSTTYYVRVRAQNGDGIDTVFCSTGSAVTLPTPIPTGLSAQVLGVSSINWTWNPVTGAGSYNLYEATAPATLVISTPTPGFVETGLSTNTQYGLMVTAVVNTIESAQSPAVSSYTFAAAPGPLTFSGVTSNQFTVTWATNGNPLTTTPYEVDRSTDGFVADISTPIPITDNFVSNTTTFAGLTPSTTYYIRVRARNGDLVFSTFSVVDSTETLPPLPNNPAAVTDLTAAANGIPGGAYLTWTAPGEQGTVGVITSGEFRIAYTTDAVVAQSTVTWSTATAQVRISTWNVTPGTPQSATLSLLGGGATYYFRLWTENSLGYWSDLSNGATAQTFVFSPTNLSPFVLGTTSITWSWSDSRNLYVDGYNLLTGAGGWVAAVGGGTLNVTDVGLSTNTLYAREVQAFTGASSSATLAVSAYTLAAPPVSSTWSAVTSVSVAVTWGANGNPAGTLYHAEVSAQSSFGTSMDSSTVLTTATITGLSGLLSNATYYARVQAQNGAGIATGFDVTLTTVTPAAEPVNGQFTAVSGSTLTISWGGSTNGNGTLYQAELSTLSAVGASTQTVVGTSLNATFTGLIPNTTYYARVKALGWTGEDSDYLYIGQIVTSLDAPTNVRFIDVGVSSVTAAWDPITQPNVQYVAWLHDSDILSKWISTTTLGTTAGFSGLAVNAQYYFYVQSQDRATLIASVPSVVISTYTLANPPVALSTTSVASNSVGLSWKDGGNPAGTFYSVERSLDGVTFAVVATQPALTYLDMTVEQGTTYRYQVRALNGNNVPSAPSNMITVTTLGVIVAPKTPSGFWADGQAVGSANSVTYHWETVTERVDGSPLTNLAGYQIYVSKNILAPTSEWILVTTVTTNAWSMTAFPGVASYYAVRAVDAGGLASGCTHGIDDSSGLVHYFMAPDGVTRAEVPQSAANVLRKLYNSFATNLTLQWAEVTADETGRVVRSMKLEAVSDVTGNAIANFAFSDPALVGIITYAVANGQVVAGTPEYSWLGAANSPAMPIQNTYAPAGSGLMPASQAAGDLSLFWYNGAEWVKTTGQVDTTNNAMSYKGGRIGYFQIRVASHAPTPSQISLTKVYPRIITPNGDGWNDKVIFQFDNPQLLPLSGQIYDVTGAKVAGLSVGRMNPDSTLEWDGKDSAGRVVPAGIYIYEVDISGSSPMTGTVVVAR